MSRPIWNSLPIISPGVRQPNDAVIQATIMFEEGDRHVNKLHSFGGAEKGAFIGNASPLIALTYGELELRVIVDDAQDTRRYRFDIAHHLSS